MTEQEWLACNNLKPMLEFLWGRASERKLRLFACACCRRIWHWFDDNELSRRAIEVAERYADGQTNEQELVDVNQAPGQSSSVTFQATVSDAGAGAFGAAHCIAEAITNCFPVEEIEAAYQAECLEQSRLARCVFGNPFRLITIPPAWLSPTLLALAQDAYDNRTLPAGTLDKDRLADLADAFEEGGCDDADILSHCRQGGEHVRGCWVVDLLLGKG